MAPGTCCQCNTLACLAKIQPHMRHITWGRKCSGECAVSKTRALYYKEQTRRNLPPTSFRSFIFRSFVIYEDDWGSILSQWVSLTCIFQGALLHGFYCVSWAVLLTCHIYPTRKLSSQVLMNHGFHGIHCFTRNSTVAQQMTWIHEEFGARSRYPRQG